MSLSTHRQPPGTINLPANDWNNEDSALLTDESATNDPDRAEASQPVWPDNSTSIPINTFRDDELPAIPDKPAIPNALPTSSIPGVSPLPKLPMAVLSIAMLGEFLTANVSAPWILFLCQSFHMSDDDAEVAYWTGVLSSTFFITQFITSLLWATVAQKYGRRTVLFIALLGMSLSVCAFGTARSYGEAVAIRLLQGVFGGAVGVARGSVTSIADVTNEGRAYAIMGFAWGMGGVAGAIVGGAFESPAKNYPSIFGHVELFKTYPYLLPCMVAGSVTLIGSILSLGLGYDGGPREGAIRLEDKENAPISPIAEVPEEERPGPPPPSGVVNQLKHKVSQGMGAAFRRGSTNARGSFAGGVLPSSLIMSPAVPSSSKPRTMSRTSRAGGSAYGYSSAARTPLGSFSGRRPSFVTNLRRRNTDTIEQGEEDAAPANFAQRLLLANELQATSLADMWVQAAITVDNEDVFETDSESQLEDEDASTPLARSPVTSPPGMTLLANRSNRPSTSAPSTHRASFNAARRPSLQAGGRRPSAGSFVPAIFAHTGVRTPPALQHQLPATSPGQDAPMDYLAPIAESRPVSTVVQDLVVDEKMPSTWSQLPKMIILQYGLLALHTTVHDQVFYLYLVSKYPAGGLGLTAAHFSQLIAMMCLVQIVYQFYLYPNIGPPRGRFSHLSMFRVGSLLFIPAYLTVTLYRYLATPGDGGNFLVMCALVFSTAIRYCGTTFTYTAVAILLNYTSPPPIVGLANGLAQSIVSLARFVGPIVGGYLWSVSIADDPSGYAFGFFVVSAVCGFAVLQSFMIR